jgi:hypothetical protein
MIQGMLDSAERVLKKPFRTPGVVLSKISRQTSPPSPGLTGSSTDHPESDLTEFFSSSPSKTIDSPPSSDSPSWQPLTPTLPSKTEKHPRPKVALLPKNASSQPRRGQIPTRKTQLSKPFKSPMNLDRSNAPSPSTASSRSTYQAGSNTFSSPLTQASRSVTSSSSRSQARNAGAELASLE